MGPEELKRFCPKVRVSPFGCWQWLAGQNGIGYGTFRCGDKLKLAHRASYEHFVGPIPNGLEIDHLCRNRACVNPAHMEVVTHRENTLRGATVTAANARKTHCNRGHRFTEANTYKYGGRPGRYCRACRRLHVLKWDLAKKKERATV